MSRTIWKVPVQPDREPQRVSASEGDRPIALAAQGPELVMWFEHDASPDADHEWMQYAVVGTGWDWPRDGWEHVATAQRGPFVWHLYRESR